jgi:membrane-associated phospholipid phosphatase
MKKLRLAACALALGALGVAGGAAATVTSADRAGSPDAARASSPASWKPWLLTSADQFRIKGPPAADSAQTKTELKQLLRLQKTRTTASSKAAINKWCTQASVVAWTDLAIKMVQSYRPRPPVAARLLAMFETSLYDAVIAAEDSRLASAKGSRPAPWLLDKRLSPAMKVAAGSTWAPYDAAIAGAAETVLAFLFPGEPKRTFTLEANEAINTRLLAGLNYRSDVQNARILGQKVASLEIARDKADGHLNTGFAYPQKLGEGYWGPTPPAFEPAIGGPVGTWKTWLMSSPDQFLHVVPGPSAYGSPEFMRQVKQVFDVNKNLTADQRQIANFWDDGPGTMTPAGHWFSIATQLIKTYKVSHVQAARILATLGATEADAVIAAWNMKYFYWSIRPITAIWRLGADGTTLHTSSECIATPSLCPNRNVWYSIITTPGFPSYPSGHSSFSGAAGRVLTYFFPKAGESLNLLANQAAQSRLYGGIHYDEDNRDGLVLGRAVADLAIARARADGAR